MSVIISQTYRPVQNTMYAKNTVPKLLVEATENISVQLRYWSWSDRENAQWGEADIVFSGSYAPDFLGEIWLDYGDLYGAYLNTVMPGSATTIVQSANIGYFHLFVADSAGNVIQDSALKWYVFNGMLNASLPFETWSQQNFLTNQPLEKPTTFDSPEYLTFLDLDTPAGRKVKVIFYPKSGGNETRQLTTTNIGGCYSVNVSYAIVIRLANHLSSYYKGYYDVILTDSSNNELARQRYIYQERSGKEHYFLFVNALGGVDTMICDGENVLQPETTYNIGRFGKQFIPIDDTDDNRQWTQETGMVPYRWRNWMHELLTAKRDAAFYNQQDQTMNPIVITESSIAMGDNGQLASASFSYMLTNVDNVMADTERALNRSLHQSVADEAEEMDDFTEGQVMAFAPVQGGEGYETEEVTLSATKIYVIYPKSAQSHIIGYAVGGKDGYTFDTADEGPFIIDKSATHSLQFFCDDDLVPALELRYYPTANS